MNNNTGVVLWFTGLSGSGKTTIAYALGYELINRKKSFKLFDGDEMRKKLHKNLGFTEREILRNNMVIANHVIEDQNKYDFIIVPIISPFISHRNQVRKKIRQNFNEVYIKSSIERCIERDVKGLYEKAARGEIKNMIGFSEKAPYEPPKKPEIIIDTDILDLKKSLNYIMTYLNI